MPDNLFPPRDLTDWNETSVREEILAPLYRALGYAKGTANDCITELYLRYPKKSLGRKSKRDPDLVGRADYVFEVDKRLRWVMEAKPAREELTQDDREQAFTYASHPEVCGLFFVLSNGRRLEIHRTAATPTASLVFECEYAELESKFHVISNILSPAYLKRNFSDYVLDTGVPIAPGFRSIAKIVTGKMVHRAVSLKTPGINMIGITSQITDGSVQRMPDGKIISFFKVEAPYDQITQHVKSIGMDAIEMVTDDATLSTDRTKPTRFSSAVSWGYAQGATVPDVANNTETKLAIALDLHGNTEAKGYLIGRKFVGDYCIKVAYHTGPFHILNLVVTGDFEIEID